MIEERIRTVTRSRVITPAKLKSVDTGEKQEVKVTDTNGEVRIEERPVFRDELQPAVTETLTEKIKEYIVLDRHSGEEHIFTSLEAAQRFKQ